MASTSSSGHILVLDNGSHTLRAAIDGRVLPLMPNFALRVPVTSTSGVDGDASGATTSTRLVIGPSIQTLAPHQLTSAKVLRPVGLAGVLMDAALQFRIWRVLLSRVAGLRSEADVDLVVTVAAGTPAEAAALWYTLCFRMLRFRSVVFVSAPLLRYLQLHPTLPAAARAPAADANVEALIVDVGHTGTTVTSIYGGVPRRRGYTRMDLGGANLTARLQSQLSFTQVDLRDAEWVAERFVKEQLLRTSPGLRPELARWEAAAARAVRESRRAGSRRQRSVVSAEALTLISVDVSDLVATPTPAPSASTIVAQLPDASAPAAGGDVYNYPASTLVVLEQTASQVGRIARGADAARILLDRREALDDDSAPQPLPMLRLEHEPAAVAELLFAPHTHGAGNNAGNANMSVFAAACGSDMNLPNVGCVDVALRGFFDGPLGRGLRRATTHHLAASTAGGFASTPAQKNVKRRASPRPPAARGATVSPSTSPGIGPHLPPTAAQVTLVLCGGTAQMEGFQSRFLADFASALPPAAALAPPTRADDPPVAARWQVHHLNDASREAQISFGRAAESIRYLLQSTVEPTIFAAAVAAPGNNADARRAAECVMRQRALLRRCTVTQAQTEALVRKAATRVGPLLQHDDSARAVLAAIGGILA